MSTETVIQPRSFLTEMQQLVVDRQAEAVKTLFDMSCEALARNRSLIALMFGTMFGGKTAVNLELIMKLKELELSGKKVLIFKLATENRYGVSSHQVASLNGLRMEAIPINSLNEIFSFIEDEIIISLVEFPFMMLLDPTKDGYEAWDMTTLEQLCQTYEIRKEY